MAAITSTLTTQQCISAQGSLRTFTIDYTTAAGMTTAAASDTVVTPLDLVIWAQAVWGSTANAAAAHHLTCGLSTTPSNIFVNHTTHGGSPSVRIIVHGR